MEIRLVSFEVGTVHAEVYDVLFRSARAAFRAVLAHGETEALKNYMNVLECLLRMRQACCTHLLIREERVDRSKSLLKEMDQRCQIQANPLTPEEAKNLFLKLKGTFENEDGAAPPECAVCLESIKETKAIILRMCRHVYCQDCMNRMLSSNTTTSQFCPLCRSPFVPSDVTRYAMLHSTVSSLPIKQPAPTKTPPTHSPKILALLSAIGEMPPSEKGVIFSQFTKFLDVIAGVLASCGHSFVRIDGSVNQPDRARALNLFNDSAPRFILCSLLAAGTGINLTRGNHVFLMDPWWNSAAENQAMDRVHRIGQERKVRVVKFVVEGSVEERVVNMQRAKEVVGRGVVEKVDPGELRKARVGALMDLFRIDGDDD